MTSFSQAGKTNSDTQAPSLDFLSWILTELQQNKPIVLGAFGGYSNLRYDLT